MHAKTFLFSMLFAGSLSVAGSVCADEPVVRVDGSLDIVSAEVVAVDMDTRAVTLKGADGELVDFVAGPEVRNLAQVEVGDMVDMEHSQVLVTELVKSASGLRQRVDTVEAARAELGDKPAGVIRRTVDFRASVHSLDKAQRRVTLLGAKGLVTLVVQSDINLDRVSVGDMVEGTFVERLVIAVSPR
jgi:hypothetical protein